MLEGGAPVPAGPRGASAARRTDTEVTYRGGDLPSAAGAPFIGI